MTVTVAVGLYSVFQYKCRHIGLFYFGCIIMSSILARTVFLRSCNKQWLQTCRKPDGSVAEKRTKILEGRFSLFMLRLQDLRIIMDRDESCTMPSMYPPCSGDYSLDQLQIHRQSRSNNTDSIDDMNSSPMGNAIIDMFSMQQQHQLVSSGSSHALLDKTNFNDVMSFADYGPKLALQIDDSNENREGFDPVYFLKFPVLASDHKEDDEDSTKHLDDCLSEQLGLEISERGNDSSNDLQTCEAMKHDLNLSGSFSMDANCGAQSNVTGMVTQVKQKRKRTRAVKNSEEVESQRMTHIAVERNRRKQMNEHLRVLRSLMPGSYVQRGDQASIIGGAIEFVRELEQLLQCLESQKRRRMIAEVSTMRPIVQQQEPNPLVPMQVPYPVYSVNNNNNNMEMKYVHDHGSSMYDPTSLREDVSDSKSAVADVEVKLLGYDAMIKILSQRRPGQLLKTIAALETQLQFSIMHTNVTTIEHTVLYSFNVKIGGECKVTAEEIANAVQQIFNMIHASTIGYIKD